MRRSFLAGLLVLCLLFSCAFAEQAAPAPTAQPLKVSLTASTSYSGASAGDVVAEIVLRGGEAPYTATFLFSLEGRSVATEEKTYLTEGTYNLLYTPTRQGKYSVTVLVTDAAEASAEGTASFSIVSDRLYENETDWQQATQVELTGDWRTDLIAVAQTQIGYHESKTNTETDADGVVHGYSRYGHWYGDPYMEWCAAFVSFCFEYAQIPIARTIRAGSVPLFIQNVRSLGAYHAADEGYEPEAGDIAFMVPDNDSSHMGVIEYVTGGIVGTIEGNASRTVDRRSYQLGSKQITGYASMAELMQRKGVEPVTTPDNSNVTDYGGVTARTVKANVNLRRGPSTSSPRIVQLTRSGTKVTVSAGMTTEDGTLWYQCIYRGKTGYIRADLLVLEEPEAKESAEPDASPEPAAEPTDEPTVEPAPEPSPDATAEPLTVLAEPEDAAWLPGEETVTLRFTVAGAESYRWQVNDGGRWANLPEGDSSELTLAIEPELLMQAYRCVARGNGEVITSREVTLLPLELVQWLREAGSVSEEMLQDAITAWQQGHWEGGLP